MCDWALGEVINSGSHFGSLPFVLQASFAPERTLVSSLGLDSQMS
jgi:hypothetical protein